MSDHDEVLFHGVDCFSVITHQRQQMLAEIAGVDANRLLNTNPDDLAAYFAEKYLADVPVLHEDRMTVDQREAQEMCRAILGDWHTIWGTDQRTSRE